MKHLISITAFFLAVIYVHAQKYPDPEFANEVYYLKKIVFILWCAWRNQLPKWKINPRLRVSAVLKTVYEVAGSKSDVRLNGTNLSFVVSNGPSASASSGSSSQRDSIMKANGMDPSMMGGMSGMSDPATSVTLYKADANKARGKYI
jgi:hypothetical protein